MSKTVKRGVSLCLCIVILLSVCSFCLVSNAAYENTWVNTGNQRLDIIEIAKTQDGNTNGSKYGSGNWCAHFVSWCARQADIPESILKSSSRAGHAPSFFDIQYFGGGDQDAAWSDTDQTFGKWGGNNYTPDRGDLFFTTTWSHVGLVASVDKTNRTFTTIEGNSGGGKVTSHTYNISDYYFGVPPYEDNSTPPTPPEPDTVSVSTDKKSYCVGENAIFSFNAENASSLHLYIYLDGNYWFQGEYTPSSTYTRYLSATGHYAYYIVAHYASGDIESAWNDYDVVQDFSEYIPAKPDVWAEKGQVAINEEVQIFHWSEKATSYLISIYKDGIWQYAETHYTSSFTISFSDAGNYSVAVQAINNYGESSWNTLVVTVYAPVPQKPDVWVDTSLVSINQDVTIYHWSEKATSYLISVYKDGIWQYAETHYTSSFTTSFSDAGNYSIAVQAINDYGGSEWNTVSISVYDETIVATPIVEPGFDGVVINEENYFIYGLSAGGAQGCVAVTDGTVAYEYSNTKQALGTGTKVNVYNNDNVLVDSYTVVVFGDVDGDSWYDGTDAYFVRLVASGMVPQAALTAAQLKACDANHDGVIDEADAALLEQAGLLLNQIDQTATQQELQTNGVYLEYCSLIDQSAEITESTVDEPTQTEETPQPAVRSVFTWLKALFAALLNWLLRVF